MGSLCLQYLDAWTDIPLADHITSADESEYIRQYAFHMYFVCPGRLHDLDVYGKGA